MHHQHLLHLHLQPGAVQQFIKSIPYSHEHDGEWLSQDEVLKLLHIFQHDEKATESYITIAGKSDESFKLRWVRTLLSERDNNQSPL